MKKILMLCASHNDIGVLLALKKMGYYIIVTGNRPGLPGEKYADEYIEADYSNKELILSIAKEKKVDRVCQCCNDFGVYTAAYVAEQLGLPGYDSYDTTLKLHNKDRFKEFAAEIGLSTPLSKSFSDKASASSWCDSIEYPIIVKPSDASAGNGISKVESRGDADNAIEKAFSVSRNGHIVIEPYIVGTQHGFCTFLIDRKVVAVCSNNEYSIANPYRVEIDTYPSTTFNESKDYLIGAIEDIAQRLDLCDGIFHLQYIFSNGKPYIIEVMRRTLGNMYSELGNRLNNMDWDYWEARARTGMSLDGFPEMMGQEGYYAYKTLIGPRNGTVKDVKVSDILKKHTFKQFDLWHPGYEITHHDTEPLGFLFLIFSSQEEMKTILLDDYGGVEVVYDRPRADRGFPIG